MLDRIEALRHEFTQLSTLDARIDHAFKSMKGFGFDALIYDYTPVPIDPAGNIMIPSLMKLRNIVDGMHEYWCDRGYFLIDPVQILAAQTSSPFFWNYEAGAETRIRRFVNSRTEPVARYLLERDMSTGVTVPIHMPWGGYATVTGILGCSSGATQRHVQHHIADFDLLAHIFHETAYQEFGKTMCGDIAHRLTHRERQCLRYSAEGLSAKEISRIIGRSVPTVVMHLSTATRKLGARNRTQAVAIAIRYGLLIDDVPRHL